MKEVRISEDAEEYQQIFKGIAEHILNPIFDNFDQLGIEESDEQFERLARDVYYRHCHLLCRALLHIVLTIGLEHPEVMDKNKTCDPALRKKFERVKRMASYLSTIYPRVSLVQRAMHSEKAMR